MDDLLVDSWTRLLDSVFSPAEVRQVETSDRWRSVWASIQDSGFLDVLVTKSSGGAGLSLSDVFPLFLQAGRHASPVPMVETMLARACIAQAGHEIPQGAVGLLPPIRLARDGDALEARIPYAGQMDWVLTETEGQAVLLPVDLAQPLVSISRTGAGAVLRWETLPGSRIVLPGLRCDIEILCAATYAALLAGAMDRVVSMTLEYASQRQQFGRPIAKFQAIQNQLAVMAENALAARIAAQLACQAPGGEPQRLLAMMGKARTSQAAAVVADIAHAVHGAIGITEEYDLQLYTRRLRVWRLFAGAESFWEQRLGDAVLAGSGSMLSFLCDSLYPPRATSGIY